MAEPINQIKAVYDKIIANYENTNCHCSLELFPIVAIDGIKVCVESEILRVATTNAILIRMNIYDDWKKTLLYEYRVDQYEDLQTFIEVLPRLKFNPITNALHDGEELQQYHKNLIIGYDLYKCMDKTENVKARYDECVVCMEDCRTRTSCKHTICLKCESRIHTQTCPCCRAKYEHYIADLEEDDE